MPLLMMHMTKPPVSPREHNPQLPPPLEQMILKLLEKDPANRYSSCKAFADDLRRLRGTP
jgi:serine/threonine-protein kinase